MLGVAAAAGLTGKTRAGPDTNQGMETSLGGGLTATLPAVDPRMDPESRAWVAALSSEGGDREAALARLAEAFGPTGAAAPAALARQRR